MSAASPDVNAAVRASAGTGKTWLLITRLVRLLLADVPPQAILAITFTRKAAAEMQGRILARLFELASCGDAELDRLLAAMDAPVDDGLKRKARELYERLLIGEAQLNITTFHAFCQHILRRFPLEADVPPGFEVAEHAGLLQQAAWDALFEESTREPDGLLARSLEALFEQCGGLSGAQSVLSDFLQRRGDWLAYTDGVGDACAYATEQLSRRLAVEPGTPPAGRFFTTDSTSLLREFLGLLLRHPTATNRRHAGLIERALDGAQAVEQRLAWAQDAFFRQDGQPLARAPSAALLKKLGEAGQQRFVELHRRLCEALSQARELQYRWRTFQLSRAWYRAGTRLLGHYQSIKQERRQLDFADLEWKAYQLLNRPEHMLWVQYKLDQSIDHVLIDEFQDTNPTQWHLIRPLLEELGDASPGGGRSVFLVGDDKQSIYRFRRADPRLFDAATRWLTGRPGGAVYRLDTSYRSAPAILEFVNRVFSGGTPGDRLDTFSRHDTRHRGQWGRVEILPVIEDGHDDPGDGVGAMRNPLERPRAEARINRHYAEGRQLAERIQGLIAEPTLIDDREGARPLRLSDIVILVRDRTHAGDYELALRDAGIPYLGISRGSLLSSLEVTDMLALLNTLAAPYDNLALATVLRSPLFDCSDEDLMTLAVYPLDAEGAAARTWMERLVAIAAQQRDGSALQRAGKWLAAWCEAADRVPVHDLLDRIYCEADVMARYESGYPDHLRGRVRANLTRFIELALEVDSGRYPSLSHFLAVLRNLQEQGRDGPDEGPPPSLDAVRLMTVHAAKGLEAPAVFLADTAWTKQRSPSYHTMVSWPPEADRPAHFHLTGKRSQMDELSRELHAADERAERREEVNLLYVALTRARQLLVVSGCRPARGRGDSWYDLMVGQVAPAGLDGGPWVYESGAKPAAAAPAAAAPSPPAPEVDPRLAEPVGSPEGILEIAPSRAAGNGHESGAGESDEDARTRGVAIHRMLELLAGGTLPASGSPPKGIAGELSVDPDEPDYAAWWREACRVYRSPELARLFDPGAYVCAYNEVPFQYEAGGRHVHGVIDRLVVYADEVVLIDYKTHAAATPANLAALAVPYRETMELYRQGVGRIWPDKRVSVRLLFTACAALYAPPHES